MDEQEISQLIETSLEAILSGRASLDDILKQNPEYADQLRVELESAVWLVSKRDTLRARPGFVSTSRKRVVDQIRQEASRSGTKRAFLGFVWPRQFAFRWATAFVMVVVLIAGSGSVVSASQSALPGEGLYPVKRMVEQVSYDLSTSTTRRVFLSNEYSDRRMDEAEALLVRHSYENAGSALVDFQKEVNRSLVLLGQINDTNVREKKQAAVLLSENLSDQAERIETLAQSIPSPLRNDLNQAMDLSAQGAKFAFGVAEGIDVATTTPTATPNATFTSEATQTSVPTGTPVPTNTVEPPANDPGDSESPVETETPNGAKVKTPKPTKDPKNVQPTNENRSPKPENPPKEPKGGEKEPRSGSGSGK